MTGQGPTYFVSGHLDLTNEEFAQHYAPRLTQAIDQNANFVVGDAHGCDTKAQQFLAKRVNAIRVIVFHMLAEPRNMASGFALLRGGFKSDEQRDAAMTAASTDDIAWVRPATGGRGTRNNLVRRFRLGWPGLPGRKVLTRLFDRMDDLLQAGSFEAADKAMKIADVTKYDDTCLLGLLSVTSSAREHLTERDGLAARIRAEYAKRGMDRDKIDRLLNPHK